MAILQLFPNQDDIKKYVPTINRNMSGVTLLPSVNTAVQNFLLPYLGATFLTDIEAYLIANTHTDITEAVRDCAAWFAVYNAIPQHIITLADMGVQQQSDNERTSNPASENAMKTALWHALRTGYDKLEYLLWDVLSPQKATLTNWAAYQGSAIVCDRLLYSPDEFQRWQPLRNNGAMEAWLDLRPAMLNAEDLYLRPILCDELIDELKTQRCSNTITPANKILLDKVNRYLAAKTIIISNAQNQTRHTGRGAKVTSIQDPLHPSTDTDYPNLETSYQTNQTIANIAELQLLNFLKANADTYPLWRDSPCNATTTPEPTPTTDCCDPCATTKTNKSLLTI